ncbi:MAG TPA: Rv3654c family TadE-like protein [Acidimicrobiia bacterium]
MTERGSATVLAMAIAGLLAVCVVGVTAVAMALTARERAFTAAEAAALAAAVASYPGTGRDSPALEAGRVAAANGARLIGCICPVEGSFGARTVTVETMVETVLPIFGRLRIRGAARAEFDPAAWLGF